MTIKNELDYSLEQQKEDLNKILKDPEGRRFFWFLINTICGVSKELTDVSNVNLTYFNAGRQKVGKALVNKITEIKPVLLAQMASEEASKKNIKKLNKK
jgi:hypothetical protein